jgi:hypothetical protein
MNSLDLGVILDGVLTKFSTDTRLLETTERDLGVKLVVTVHPDCSGLKGVSDSVSLGHVFGKDRRGEAVDRIVGGSNGFLLGVKLGHDDDGTKDLFLDDLHVGSDITKDCLQVSESGSMG